MAAGADRRAVTQRLHRPPAWHHEPVIRPDPHQDSRAERLLVLVGIVVLAFNLRPAAVSVGPVLGELTAELACPPPPPAC